MSNSPPAMILPSRASHNSFAAWHCVTFPGQRQGWARGGAVGRGVGARALALAAACFLAQAALAGQARLVTYVSPVDQTAQSYGIYLPARAASPAGYPAIFHGHGYGWSVSASFSNWQRTWADEHGWALLNINARGPTFYEGVGQEAVLEVVDDACRRFGLDRRRLFFTGASMGGTGAYREGVRYPEVFAAAAAVDGWTDWRIWHWKWYARQDMRHDIEEFRRPLLSACAPNFWPDRAMWGRVRALIDAKDTTVEPDEGLRLSAHLADLRAADPAAYRWDQALNPGAGHGGSYDLHAIYDFFLGCAPAGLGRRLSLTAYTLANARQGWLAITGIRRFGQAARVESVAGDGRISVWTDNVSRVEVYPSEAPGPERPRWDVWVDGQLIYRGLPALVRARATFDAAGKLEWWQPDREGSAPVVADDHAGDLASDPGGPPTVAPRKVPGLAGPIGDVFTQPFLVAYAAHGPADELARHRREAEDFARGWNSFFVHGPGIVAQSEDDVTADDLRSRNLVLFGSLDCSRLLRLAQRAGPMPVQIHDGSIVVAPDDAQPRVYAGPSFGCFVVRPNPLAGNRRYLLVCSGQWFTKPDGQVPEGLEYDLEKMPWAYPDYVVFNNDQHQLPFVLNVNNKPPVTYYEAASFCEAGYFDDHWRLRGNPVAEWVRATAPERARLIHVTEATRSAGALALLVADATGAPVAKARVTVSSGGAARSGVTDAAGRVTFGGLPDGLGARVLNVMATGCAHDRGADCAQASDVAAGLRGAAGVVYTGPRAIDRSAAMARLSFAVTAGGAPVTIRARLSAEDGALLPAAAQVLDLAAGERRTVTWDWRPTAGADAEGEGALRCLLQVQAEAAGEGGERRAGMPLVLPVRGVPPSAVWLTDLGAKRAADGSWTVSVTAANATDEPAEARLRGMIVQANLPLGVRKVSLSPRGSQRVSWAVPAGACGDWLGSAQLVVYDPSRPGTLARAELVLRPREPQPQGGTSLAGNP